MNFERKSVSKILTTSFWVSSFLFLVNVSRHAFNGNVAKEIKEPAQGRCQTCHREVGYKNLIASHTWHGSQKKEDGIAQCKRCETEFHLKHFSCPKKINLNAFENGTVIWGHFTHLDEEGQIYLYDTYKKEIDELRERYL